MTAPLAAPRRSASVPRRLVALTAAGTLSPDAAARAIGRAAMAALREELRTFPKPGLVTAGDPGAHRDMDAATFEASLRALRGTFRALAGAGTARAPFPVLRELGIRAEARMLAATGGVNTHRGAIFTLGLLAAAAGRLARESATCKPDALRAVLRRAYGEAVLRELPRAARSHGAIVEGRHGAGGARAEAAGGFPHLFEVALPALETSLARGASRRAAAVQCLMSAIAVLADTNLLYRGGERGLAFARAAAGGFLLAGGVHRPGWEEHAREVHAAFVARRLSPGGSADLLAAALFVHRLAGRREPGTGSA